jgi:alpha-amylase
LKLSLCVHCHQPVGNFDDVVSGAWRDAYLPLLESLERHPSVKMGLHLSGCLAEWILDRHPDAFDLVRELCGRGTLELLSSGFYEPVLPVWDREDITRQIVSYSDLMEEVAGVRPAGLWLTERVWEPGLASVIAGAGIRWAVVDDLHLLSAGVPPDELYGPWTTEDSGKVLVLLPGSRELRYMIPFSPVKEVRDRLREWHDMGRELAFYGDDGEKFGVWPGTADLCYGRGWLDEFLGFLEETDWLEVITPSEAVESVRARGPVYVPATSYREMGEWTLTCSQRERLSDLTYGLRDAGLLHEADGLLRGGMWRSFLSRYPESGELHGRVLHVLGEVYESGNPAALRHYWRSQCNCAYWHGVFGGIYLPHLRDALWRELHLAEQSARIGCDDLPAVSECDIDADGNPELLVRGGGKSLLVRPAAGLTVSEFSWLPGEGAPVPLGHVLSRRPEAYHSLPGDTPGDGEPVGSIHDTVTEPAPGVEDIVYDSWRRISFSDLVLPEGSGMDEWLASESSVIHFQDSPAITWNRVERDDAVIVEAVLASSGFTVEKEMCIPLGEPSVSTRSLFVPGSGLEYRAGVELCFCLLSGRGPERCIVLGDGPPAEAGGTGMSGRPVNRIRVRDLWREVEVDMHSREPVDVWYTGLESLSRSEKGYEKVYQGTALYLSTSCGGGKRSSVELTVRLGRPAH